MRSVVLVPRREDNGWRDRLWSHVRSLLGGFEVVEGHHVEGQFNRSAALNAAARLAGNWDVAVILDSDTITPVGQIRDAIHSAATSGKVSFAFERYRALNEAGTRRIVDEGFDGSWEPYVTQTIPMTGSSCLAVRRDLWEEVQGFDERFQGWGWEDVAFSWACQTLGGGMVRIPGDCWHLWHPAAEGAGDISSPIYQANRELSRPYERAANDPAAMRAVIARSRA